MKLKKKCEQWKTTCKKVSLKTCLSLSNCSGSHFIFYLNSKLQINHESFKNVLKGKNKHRYLTSLCIFKGYPEKIKKTRKKWSLVNVHQYTLLFFQKSDIKCTYFGSECYNCNAQKNKVFSYFYPNQITLFFEQRKKKTAQILSLGDYFFMRFCLN